MFFLVATIPVSGVINSVAIIVLTLSSFFQCKNTSLNKKNINFLIPMWLFFFYLVLSLSYTHDMKNGFFQIEKKLSLLVMPFIFYFSPLNDKESKSNLLIFFAITCTFFCAGCFLIGFYKFIHLNLPNSMIVENFTNQNLSGYIGVHSTYLSMFVLLSISVLLDRLISNKDSLLVTLIIFFAIMFMLIFIILLASRIVFLSFIAVIVVLTISRSEIIIRNKILFLIFVSLITSCFLISYQRSNYIKNRINEVFFIDYPNLIGSQNENGVTQRVFFWRNSIEIIMKSPIIGHGTGDSNSEFEKQYDELILQSPGLKESVKNAILYFKEKHFNAHNQYLETTISLGLIGLASLLFIYGYSLFYALKRKNFLHISFISIVIITSLTESILERQQGIIFFLFFNCLFLFNKNETHSGISSNSMI